MYGIDDIAAQREAHLKCYDALFPYASQIMSYLAMNSGFQGFALGKPLIQFADINFGTKPNTVESGKVIKL